ncbi:hypothetical protein VNO77_23225 [Canavalia gladiata]|uniref:Aminotransferase-like plant mobile domain-containing protein n=1 Tax=Canavalia gladiata TaxID=3824 RepID=A0AAN9L7G6_CANGL
MIAERLRRAGFLGVTQLPFIHSDASLVKALVERWRLETHTFHMLPGECTITLQDIAVLTGLPIDGQPVIGITSTRVWETIVQDLLGAREFMDDFPDACIVGSKIWTVVG